MRLYQLAADQGNAMAHYNLAYCTCTRMAPGVSQDYAEAVRLFQLAADQGIATAQFKLGVMYKDGTGVTQDFTEAARWYSTLPTRGKPWRSVASG